MTGTKELTPRQADVYEYIVRHIRKTTIPPTVREIAYAFEINSPNGVMCHLKALEKKGMITRDSRMSRGIRLVRAAGEDERCPLCGGRVKGGGR